jgi:hypothetical protein
MTDFMNLNIKSALFFKCAHKDEMYVYAFIWVGVHLYRVSNKERGKEV